MTRQFNPKRLVLARHRRGVSRWALATELDLPSVAALGRIETGKKVPDEVFVEMLAAALRWPVGFFYLDDPPEIGATS